MNFLEALNAAKESGGKLWARPKGSKMFFGFAWKTNPDRFDSVPSDRGGEPAFLPSPAHLFGEWEVFNPANEAS